MCPLPIHYSICLPLSSLHPHSHCLLIFFSPCRMLMRAIVEHLLFTAPPISLETSSLSFASLLILFYLPNFLGLTLPPPPPNTHTRYLSHIFIFIAMSLLSLPVSLPQPIVSVFLLLAALWFCLSCTLSPLCLLRLSVSHPLAHFLFQPFLSL